MRIVRTPAAMQALSRRWRAAGDPIGFVPTMGALHRGHASLLARARRENAKVVVSIFVNPLQFGPKEDFSRYPRPFAKDAALCRREGADAVYHPSAAAMYRPDGATRVEPGPLAEVLEGISRPGHFSGVATVVLKLLNAVQPERAYFGEKDYQQLLVVRALVRDLDVPTRIVGCPTVREKDGLALSSRNAYLSPEERAQAAHLSAGLRAAAALARAGETRAGRLRAAAMRGILRIPGVRVDYLTVADAATLAPQRILSTPARLLAAVRLGKTRLIDNITIP